MKTCPSCRKTYEDESLVFCLDDGARLVRKGADPNATWNLPLPGPTVASPRPTSPPAQSTITSPPEQFHWPQVRGDDTRGESRRGTLPWVFAIVLVLGASGVLIAWLMTRERAGDTGARSSTPTPVPSVTTTPSPKPEFAVLDNMTFHGSRITYYQRTSFELCQADCAGNPNCKGLTWIRPGAYNPNDPGMCYLMASVGDRVAHTCCISAVRN